MKRGLFLFVFLLCLAGCSNEEYAGITYERKPLEIAVIGELPALENDHLTFTGISLSELGGTENPLSETFDALMVTPSMFVEASQDEYAAIYHEAQLPLIFWESPKKHYPFMNGKIRYLNEKEVALNNSDIPHTMETNEVHTALYFYDQELEQATVWNFYLNEQGDLEKLAAELFSRLASL